MQLQMRHQRNVLGVVMQRHGDDGIFADDLCAGFGVELHRRHIHQAFKLVLRHVLPVKILRK